VSGCPTHGSLVGGYVLGALEPDEMEQMRRHLEHCPDCSLEASRLAGLPQLLDRIEPADVPPPALSPEVEEAVLDRFARERGDREQRGPWRERSRSAVRHGPRRRIPGTAGRRIAAVAAACAAALVLALALVWPFGGDEDEPAYASAALNGLAAAPGANATAELDDVPAGTHVRLRARGLPRGGGAMYEVWCVRADGRWISGGTFRADREGGAEAELTAGVRPGDYHLIVVTTQPRNPRDGTRGTPVLRGRLRY
jgi:anti-sigma-K factor RskA